MKSTLQIIVAFLVAAMIFQSCTVYYKRNFTPEEVVRSQKKFRMIDKEGKAYPFYKLIQKDSNFYALAKKSIFYKNEFRTREPADLGYEGFLAYQIDPQKYEKFKIKNTAGSAIATAVIGLIASTVILWVALDNYLDDLLFLD